MVMINPTYKLLRGTELTPYQLYRAKWQLFPQYRIVDRMPIHVDIELNTTCNRECSYCQQSFDKPEPRILHIAMIEKIIEECGEKGVCSIKLNWRGEPLLYPKLEEYIKAVKPSANLVSVTTNGTLLNEEMLKKLKKWGVDILTVSLDSAIPQEHDEFRGRSGCFHEIYKGIKRLLKHRKK